MIKPFVYGYEKKSADSLSIQVARAHFLTLVLELKPEAVSLLYNTAHKLFSELVTNNQATIASISESVESEIPESAFILRTPEYIRAQAL